MTNIFQTPNFFPSRKKQSNVRCWKQEKMSRYIAWYCKAQQLQCNDESMHDLSHFWFWPTGGEGVEVVGFHLPWPMTLVQVSRPFTMRCKHPTQRVTRLLQASYVDMGGGNPPCLPKMIAKAKQPCQLKCHSERNGRLVLTSPPSPRDTPAREPLLMGRQQRLYGWKVPGRR